MKLTKHSLDNAQIEISEESVYYCSNYAACDGTW